MRHTLETTDAAIKRWESKLTRAMRQLSKLRLQRRRLEKAAARPRGSAPMLGDIGPAIRESIQDQMKRKVEEREADPVKPEPLAVTIIKELAADENVGSTTWTKPTTTVADIDVPDFLVRNPDPAAAQLKAEIEETKKRKTKGRIEKMKAKSRGDLKKMPLSGKAALDFINQG